MRSLDVIVDLQFGSTGKGLIAGYLAARRPYDTIVTAWAPNAGHTFIDKDGNKYVHRSFPNGVVGTNVQRIMIGPGSVIDPVQFKEEYIGLVKANLMWNKEVMIHPYAAVVTEEHREAERATMFKIGSTMKGVGEAMCQKIRRDPQNLNVACEVLGKDPMFAAMLCSDHRWNTALEDAEHVLIEGAQGFSLSINQGFYPYTTSRDCTVPQLLVDCGIPYGMIKNAPPFVIGVARTFPIRVANRFDETGRQVGTSGPCYWDQREMKWEELGMEPELTTVTKLPRRMFTWSKYQIQSAIKFNGVTSVFLNFCNYVTEQAELFERVNHIHEAGARVAWWGYGPTERDVYTARLRSVEAA